MTDLIKHWPQILEALGGLYVILSVVNGLLPDSPNKRALGAFLNWIAALTRKDAPGTMKLPFSRGKKSGASGKLPLPLIPIMLASSLLAAGCSCFKPETRNTPGCAILHNIIDCTTDAVVGGLAQSAQAIVTQYVNGSASVDWDGLQNALVQAGIKDGGCILAQLENQLLQKAKASHGDLGRAGQVSQVFLNFKRAAKLPPDVLYCFGKGPDRVCR